MAQVMIHADDVVGQALFAEETGGFSLTDRLGGGIDVTAFARQPERYLTAVLRPESGDSMALSLLVYVTGEKSEVCQMVLKDSFYPLEISSCGRSFLLFY